MAVLLVSAFVIGALTVVAMEAFGLWIFIHRINRKLGREETKVKSPPTVSCPGDQPLHDKQGAIWILVPDKVPKLGPEEKRPIEQRRKTDILEVTPVRKNARIIDHYLILMESDGSCAEILLKGCAVAAVSATSLSSRKWAKRYPIKVESKDSVIYKGYKIIYIYLETSWEKESWCKSLRFASCNDEDKIAWFSKLNVDFHNYLTSLNAGYPSFMKPNAGCPSFMKPSASSNAELIDKSVKIDINASSKFRQFLKKLAKKASKSGQDYKFNGASISGHGERKIYEKSRSFQDFILINDLSKMDTAGNVPDMLSHDASMTSSISISSETGNGIHSSRNSDADSKHKCSDEGTLCLNVLLSRLFFDANNSLQIKSYIQSRIQRALSNMRIPSYIGEITCTAVRPGSLPPHILAMRVLPSNMNEVWSLEIDVEYLGGMGLEFETRLEIQESEFEGEETCFGTNNAGEVTSDLLEGFEYLGEELKLSEEAPGDNKLKEGMHDTDETENSKSTAQASSQGSRWRSILHSITKQVSQVSLSLGIEVSSLSGTIQLCMKPPPSDQIWFGFTSMPDIQFNLESFVGDHKITNGHLALFLIGRFKAAIRETLVLPNTECVGIPWMLAENDDWVPRKAAPFMWYKNNQHTASNNITKQLVPSFPSGEVTHSAEANHGSLNKSEVIHEISKNVSHIPESICESSNPCPSSSSLMDETSFQELKVPSLRKDKTQESGTRSIETDKPDILVQSPQTFTEGRQIHNSDDDDTTSRLWRIGTRERMRGLGKKMGEKLEVKRRHLEEKGRSFVDKMKAQ